MKYLYKSDIVEKYDVLEFNNIHITKSRMQMCIRLEIGELYLFGDIYVDQIAFEEELRDKSMENIVDYTMSQPGYFLAVLVTTAKTLVWNDIFGNGRVYFSDCSKLEVFDDYNSSIKDNLNEIEFFRRKSYTSCVGTFDKNIHKLPPGNCLTINRDNQRFQIADRKNEIFYLLKKGYYDLNKIIRQTLKAKCDEETCNILMFTGGKDSFYLAKAMKEMSINFRLCFVYYSNESSSDNSTDLAAVYRLAKYLDLSLDVIPFDKENYGQAIDDAITTRPLDYSFPAMYHATKVLKSKYGSIRLINGQSSDSLLCWGISGKGISSFIQRLIVSKYYFNAILVVRYLFSRIVGIFYSIYHRKGLSFMIPSNKIDLITALNAPSIYVPLWRNDEFFNYVKNEVVNKNQVTHDDVLVAKLNYLQGSSNQLVIGSAYNAGIEVIMPFLSPKLAVQAFYNKSEFLRLFFPRYEIQKEFSLIENLYFMGFTSLLKSKRSQNAIKNEWLK